MNIMELGDTTISWVVAMKVWWPGFIAQLVLLSWVTGFQWQLVGFDVIGSKAHKFVGEDFVNIVNKESRPQQHPILSQKLCHQNSVVPYSTDNRSTVDECCKI